MTISVWKTTFTKIKSRWNAHNEWMNVKFERKRPIIKAKIGQQRKQYKKD